MARQHFLFWSQKSRMKAWVLWLLPICWVAMASISLAAQTLPYAQDGMEAGSTAIEVASWQTFSAPLQIAGNGARVVEDGAWIRFLLRRTNPGDGGDPRLQGFAYAQSNAIALSASWRRLIMEGRWSYQPLAGNPHPVLRIGLFARYPVLPHALRKDGTRLRNALLIDYRISDNSLEALTINGRGKLRQQRFSLAMGAKSAFFRLQLERGGRGHIRWSLFMRNAGEPDATWHKVAASSRLSAFQGIALQHIYIRVGGYIADPPGNEAEATFEQVRMRIEQATASSSKRVAHSARKQSLKGVQVINGWEVVLAVPMEVKACLEILPAYPGATNRPVYHVFRDVSIQDYDPRGFLVHAASWEAIADYYRNHPPHGTGWMMQVGDHMVIWQRGKEFIRLGITPTGVLDVYNIYFEACSIGASHPDICESGDNFPLPADAMMLAGNETALHHALRKVTITRFAGMVLSNHTRSYHVKISLRALYHWYRHHIPSGARLVVDKAPASHVEWALLAWELPSSPRYRVVAFLYRVGRKETIIIRNCLAFQ